MYGYTFFVSMVGTFCATCALTDYPYFTYQYVVNRYLLDQQVPRQPARYITEPGPAPVPTPTPAPEPAGRGGYQNLDQQPPNNS